MERAVKRKEEVHESERCPLPCAGALGRSGSGADSTEIARLFRESMEWEIAGDTGVLPWIWKKCGGTSITDFVRDSRAMIEQISYEVHDILLHLVFYQELSVAVAVQVRSSKTTPRLDHFMRHSLLCTMAFAFRGRGR